MTTIWALVLDWGCQGKIDDARAVADRGYALAARLFRRPTSGSRCAPTMSAPYVLPDFTSRRSPLRSAYTVNAPTSRVHLNCSRRP